MTTYTDKKGQDVDVESIENEINFTREQYEDKLNEDTELSTFDVFIEAIIKATEDNDGTLEDAVFIANDAFDNI